MADRRNGESPTSNGGPTWREWRASVDARLRRLELLIAALVVAVGTPKVGGPDIPAGVALVVERIVT